MIMNMIFLLVVTTIMMAVKVIVNTRKKITYWNEYNGNTGNITCNSIDADAADVNDNYYNNC